MFLAPRMAQKFRLGAKNKCPHLIPPPQKTIGLAAPLQPTNPSPRFASLFAISMVSKVNSMDTLSNSSLSPNRLWESIYLASSNIASIQSSHESGTHYKRVLNNTLPRPLRHSGQMQTTSAYPPDGTATLLVDRIGGRHESNGRGGDIMGRWSFVTLNRQK
jgi:hypothetical protein